jgi:hypothetical protein
MHNKINRKSENTLREKQVYKFNFYFRKMLKMNSLTSIHAKRRSHEKDPKYICFIFHTRSKLKQMVNFIRG